ncbi:MAG: hypothetical protein ACREHD_20245, partial [Pirellulales bacterium]
MSLVSPDRLIHLSGVIASSGGWYISEDWDKLRPQGVSGLLVDSDSRAAVLGLLSFHGNGYVRHDVDRGLEGDHFRGPKRASYRAAESRSSWGMSMSARWQRS